MPQHDAGAADCKHDGGQLPGVEHLQQLQLVVGRQLQIEQREQLPGRRERRRLERSAQHHLAASIGQQRGNCRLSAAPFL